MRLDVFGQKSFNASFSSKLNSSCVKTGESSIMRLDELTRLVRLQRRAKQYVQTLNASGRAYGQLTILKLKTCNCDSFLV